MTRAPRAPLATTLRAALALLLTLTLAGAIGLLAPIPAQAATRTFEVDDLTFNTRDATPGNGTCRTAGNTCTLRAALEEANELAARDDPSPVTITFEPGPPDDIVLTSSTTANKMYPGPTLTEAGDDGATYLIRAPGLTIDFGGRVGIVPDDNGISAAVFFIDAPDVTIQNFTNLVGSETSIVTSPDAGHLLIANGTFTSPYEAERVLVPRDGSHDITLRDIRVGTLYGEAAIQLMSDSTVTNLTLERVVMDNAPDQEHNHYSGIDAWGDSKLVGLVVRHSTFSEFSEQEDDQIPLRFHDIELDGAVIENNRFLAGGEDSATSIYSNRVPTGAPSVIRHNVFDNTDGEADHAIVLSQGQSASHQNPLTITDNYFDGFEAAAVVLSGVGRLTAARNTFGPASYGSGTETSESGSNTLLENAHSSANSQIRTWYPTRATRSGCTVDVTVVAPANDRPTTPVTLDAYWTASNDAEVYLGRATGVNTPGTIRFPFPLGAGNLRLHTIDALGRSSQYSRTVPVTGADGCAPAVTVDQAETQPDPTYRRDIRFTLRVSEPVRGLSEEKFSLAGSTAAGARVTGIERLDPLTYTVTVRADGAGDVTLSLPAGAVTDAARNPSSASTSPTNDNTVTYRVPLALTEVTGEAGSEGCATYGIAFLGRDEFTPSATTTIDATPTPAGLVALSPDPITIEPWQDSARVTVCRTPGSDAQPSVTLTHVSSSDDDNLDGFALGDLVVPVGGAMWALAASSHPAPDRAVRPGDQIAYTLSATGTGGRVTDIVLTADLAGALDDADWVDGSVSLTVAGIVRTGTATLAPDRSGRLTLPSFELGDGEVAVASFRVTVAALPHEGGDKEVELTAAGQASEPATPCDADAPGDDSCRDVRHLIAAIGIAKTGPATMSGGQVTEEGRAAPEDNPAHLPAGEVTWAYRVTNIGSAPLAGLSVTDDQGVSVTCPATTLTPGAHMVCRGTSVIGR